MSVSSRMWNWLSIFVIHLTSHLDLNCFTSLVLVKPWVWKASAYVIGDGILVVDGDTILDTLFTEPHVHTGTHNHHCKPVCFASEIQTEMILILYLKISN